MHKPSFLCLNLLICCHGKVDASPVAEKPPLVSFNSRKVVSENYYTDLLKHQISAGQKSQFIWAICLMHNIESVEVQFSVP
jgi:hypothetical protein